MVNLKKCDKCEPFETRFIKSCRNKELLNCPYLKKAIIEEDKMTCFGSILTTCYVIKDLDTGLYKRRGDYQFDSFSLMTALYKNKKRAEYETHRFKTQDVKIVKVYIVEEKEK